MDDAVRQTREAIDRWFADQLWRASDSGSVPAVDTPGKDED